MDLNLNDLFSDAELDITCENCNKEFAIPLTDTFTDGFVAVCPNCKTNIQLQHDETTKKTLHDSAKALNELNKTLKNFGK